MKKLFGTLFIFLIIGFACYFVYVNYIKEIIPKIGVEEEVANIDEYYIYGNHFNIKGNLKITDINYDDISLVLYNGEEMVFDVNDEKEGTNISFSSSEYINEGIYIDNLDKGIYYLFLKLTYENKEDKKNPIYKYYVLKNNTEYNETIYYTLSKYNNKIIINSDEEYGTIMFNVSENKDNNIYDVTIDPGHGGLDSGALFDSYKESDFTMNISLKLKKYLESKNIKVKLTHDKGDIPSDKTMDEYNEHGRAVIPNEVKSKYTFSIHINKNNSSSVKGMEVYTPDNINYDFAKDIVNNIVNNTDFVYSTNKMYRVSDGVYTHNFTETEVKSSLNGYKEKEYKAYGVSTKSNYLYMIRETGGYLTGAYVDDSNPDKVGVNPYYNSNIGNEAYLLELSYLSNSSDLNILLKSEEKLATLIGEAIVKELTIEK